MATNTDTKKDMPAICQQCRYTECDHKYQTCPIWLAENGAVIEQLSWKCPVCHKISERKDWAQDCLATHKIEHAIGRAWAQGKTLKEVLALCKYPKELPDHLTNVTKNTRFKIPYIACHELYAYHITGIDAHGNIYVYGKWRSWGNPNQWSGSTQEWREEYRTLTDHKEDAELTEAEKKELIF